MAHDNDSVRKNLIEITNQVLMLKTVILKM